MNNTNAVWTGAEDTVLVAAIRKYGLFQWSRISSLLPRKTPQQCKSRWFNYVNPNLSKTQWTRQEDVRLVQLVRARPNQWTTIAQMLNRSVDNCVQRYRQLMADNVEGELQTAVSAAPDATTPDGDMGEFDNEMISEAQSRLAINQGKKPQRKARERAQAQAKQLADVQRMRELAMLGHKVKPKAKSKIQGIDYNAEIPFEHKPPKGPYDVKVEDEIAEKDKFNWEKNIKGVTLAAADLFTGSKYEIGGGIKKRKKKDQKEPQEGIKKIKLENNSEDLNAKDVERELKQRKKLVFVKSQEENSIDLKNALTNLKSRTDQKSVLLKKIDIDQEEIGDVHKEERRKQKSLKKNIKKLFNSLFEIDDDYDTVPVLELEVPVVYTEKEDVSVTVISRDEIMELMKPQAMKLGLPIPNKFTLFEPKDEIDAEFKRMVTIPDLPIDDFDMVAYQKIIKQIDEEMQNGDLNTFIENIKAPQDVKLDRNQLVEIIMKCTNESTMIENQIMSQLQQRQNEFIDLPIHNLRHIQDTIWVQTQVAKVDKINNKARLDNLKDDIKFLLD